MINHFRRYVFSVLLAAAALVAFAASAGAAVPAGNTGWNWSNPAPQGNSLYAAKSSNGRVWAGGANGTLIHSGDNGSTWSAARTGLLDDIRVVETIGPNSVVFAGSCALRRTDDGGVTVRRLPWSVSDDTCAAKIQAVSFTAPLIGYLLLSNGEVFRTSDGGDSWHKQGVVPGAPASGGEPVYDMHFSGGVGVVSVGSRILQSPDAGATWTPVKTAGVGAGKFIFSFASATVGFAVGERTDVLKTVDGGATWTTVGNSLSSAYNFGSLSCASDVSCIAVERDSGAVLRTTDGGQTWSTPAAVIPQATALTFVDGSGGVVVGAAGRVAATDDSGATWTERGANSVGLISGLRSSNGRAAIAIGASGVARTTDGGASWSALKLPANAEVVDATMPSAKRAIVLLKSGALAASKDGGQSWSTIPATSGAKPRAIVGFSDGSVIVVRARGVLVSHRSGAGLHAASGSVKNLSLSAADQAGKSAFVYGRRAIATTSDRGRAWRRVKVPRGAATVTRLDMVDAKNGFLLDSNAELFRTTNGGKSWKRLETTGANQAISIAFGDRKHGYITDATGRVLATTDAGATWSRQYPFYDSTAKSPLLALGVSHLRAILAVRGGDSIFSSDTAGRIGKASVLTIKPSATKVRSGAVVPVTGKLTPATGVERVAVLARIAGAKGGTQWVTQNVTVSATGTFTTKWKITATTEFIARWSGDSSHDGDAAPLKIVKLRK
ncbi:MAG: YCF48-related protein [Solirubrobacterales bacterium]